MADELDKMVSEFTPKNRYELLHKALMYALQRDKVEALNTLLEYSVDVDRFDDYRPSQSAGGHAVFNGGEDEESEDE